MAAVVLPEPPLPKKVTSLGFSLLSFFAAFTTIKFKLEPLLFRNFLLVLWVIFIGKTEVNLETSGVENDDDKRRDAEHDAIDLLRGE